MRVIDESDYEIFFADCVETGAKSLDLIPDDDLSLAVILRLLGKSNEEISALPVACQYVAAIFQVADRAHMEDFEQVYTDADIIQFVQLAIEGLFEIGETEMGEIMRKSYSIYERSRVIIEQYKNNIIKWGELLDFELWKDTLEEFNAKYSEHNYLKSSAASYIRKNYDSFMFL